MKPFCFPYEKIKNLIHENRGLEYWALLDEIRIAVNKLIANTNNMIDQLNIINSDGWVTTERIAEKAVTYDKLGEDITGKFDDIADDLAEIYARLAIIETDNWVTTNRIADANVTRQKLSTDLQTQLSQFASDITSLLTRMTTAEGQLSTQNTRLSDLESNFSALRSQVQTLILNMGVLEQRVATIEEPGWVTEGRIAEEAVTTPKINNKSVTISKLGDDVITFIESHSGGGGGSAIADEVFFRDDQHNLQNVENAVNTLWERDANNTEDIGLVADDVAANTAAINNINIILPDKKTIARPKLLFQATDNLTLWREGATKNIPNIRNYNCLNILASSNTSLSSEQIHHCLYNVPFENFAEGYKASTIIQSNVSGYMDMYYINFTLVQGTDDIRLAYCRRRTLNFADSGTATTDGQPQNFSTPNCYRLQLAVREVWGAW